MSLRTVMIMNDILEFYETIYPTKRPIPRDYGYNWVALRAGMGFNLADLNREIKDIQNKMAELDIRYGSSSEEFVNDELETVDCDSMSTSTDNLSTASDLPDLVTDPDDERD